MYLDGYEFVVVWFSFVYIFSWAWSDMDLEQMLKEKNTPKNSSKWTLNVGNFLRRRSSA